MVLSVSLGCLIIAVVLMVLSAKPTNPPAQPPRWDLFKLAWAFVVLAWLLSGVPGHTIALS